MDKKLVIAVNGVSTSGKDEMAIQIIKEYDSTYKFDNISSVDVIREIAIEKFGWDGVKDEGGRNLLSDLKDASTKYNDKPFKDYTNAILQKDSDVFFIHIREVDEIEKLKDWCSDMDINFTSVKIERKSVENIYANTGDVGATIPYDYEYILENNGTLKDWGETVCGWFSEHVTNIK